MGIKIVSCLSSLFYVYFCMFKYMYADIFSSFTIYAGDEHEMLSLRKHAYSNILKILPPKNGNFSDKKNLIFFIFLLKT